MCQNPRKITRMCCAEPNNETDSTHKPNSLSALSVAKHITKPPTSSSKNNSRSSSRNALHYRAFEMVLLRFALICFAAQIHKTPTSSTLHFLCEPRFVRSMMMEMARWNRLRQRAIVVSMGSNHQMVVALLQWYTTMHQLCISVLVAFCLQPPRARTNNTIRFHGPMKMSTEQNEIFPIRETQTKRHTTEKPFEHRHDTCMCHIIFRDGFSCVFCSYRLNWIEAHFSFVSFEEIAFFGLSIFHSFKSRLHGFFGCCLYFKSFSIKQHNFISRIIWFGTHLRMHFIHLALVFVGSFKWNVF